MSKKEPAAITISQNGKIYIGKWSGANTPPNLGHRLPVPFRSTTQELVAGCVVGYFVTEDYLGVQIKLEELPKNVENYHLLPSPNQIQTMGVKALENYASSKTAFTCGLFGAEIEPLLHLPIPKTPDALQKWNLEPEEEFAVLAAAILAGKKWKSSLQTVWMNGAWASTPYDSFCGELQRIRNSGHMAYITHAFNKNKKYVEACQTAINLL